MSLLNKTDEYIYKRLVWKAGQYNVPSRFSFLYNELPLAMKAHLTGQIRLNTLELPVLFFTKPSCEWTLLTTRQLLGYSGSDIYSIPLEAIAHLTSKKFADENAKFSSRISKQDWDELVVTSNDGQILAFHAQKGSDLFALWNILLMAIRFYRC